MLTAPAGLAAGTPAAAFPHHTCLCFGEIHSCFSSNEDYRFFVESNNPCEESQPFVGFMDINTNSSDCEKSWLETGGFDVEV